jgi:hypothetical protein
MNSEYNKIESFVSSLRAAMAALFQFSRFGSPLRVKSVYRANFTAL